MFEKITKTLSGLAFIKYINSLIDYVNTSDIDATRIKGQLDISNIPPAGLDNVINVDTVTDMLALTVDDVQNGDTVMIIGVTPPVQYQVVDDTKLGTMDAFQEYAAGTATKALADINGNNIHTTYGKLAGNNTWTGNNYWNGSAIFNKNLTIRGSATTPGDVSTYLWLGTAPEGSTQVPSIARNKQGDLVMYAADYRPCYLRSGIQTSFASVYNSDGTVEFSSLNNTPWGKYTNANGLELTVNKTPTVNTDVSNKKYVDDSIANGDVNSAKYLNITNFIPSNSDFNDYKTPGEYQVQSNTEANTIANIPTSYNDATPRGGVLSVLIGFNAPRTSLVQIYRTYGSSYVVSRTYQRCFYHENSSWTAWREIACTDEVGLLNQANTYTALNTFRANIIVSNGTAAGSQGQIVLGVKPRTATMQANIISSTTGALNYIATENTGHYFKIGNNTASTSITTNESETAIFSHNTFEFARITNVGVANWLGNANTATKLATARTINGVPFDGTKDITIDIPEPVIASEAEAKAGTDNTKFMTPLRVKQATSALAEDILLRFESGTITKEFTASDSRWTESNGMWRLTMAMGNSRLIGVYKEVKKPQYEMVLTGVYMDSVNTIIEVPERFTGIVILASLTKKTGDKVYIKNFTEEDFTKVGSDSVLTISAEEHQAGSRPIIVSLTKIIDGISYPYYANTGVDNNGNVVINVSEAFTGKIILDGGYLQ